MATSTLNDLRKYFGEVKTYPVKAFSDDWKLLPEQDKAEIKAGFEDGTLTYPDRKPAGQS